MRLPSWRQLQAMAGAYALLYVAVPGWIISDWSITTQETNLLMGSLMMFLFVSIPIIEDSFNGRRYNA